MHLAALNASWIKIKIKKDINYISQSVFSISLPTLAKINDTFVGDANEHDILNSHWQNSKHLFVKE